MGGREAADDAVTGSLMKAFQLGDVGNAEIRDQSVGLYIASVFNTPMRLALSLTKCCLVVDLASFHAAFFSGRPMLNVKVLLSKIF